MNTKKLSETFVAEVVIMMSVSKFHCFDSLFSKNHSQIKITIGK